MSYPSSNLLANFIISFWEKGAWMPWFVDRVELSGTVEVTLRELVGDIEVSDDGDKISRDTIGEGGMGVIVDNYKEATTGDKWLEDKLNEVSASKVVENVESLCR